MCWLQGISLYWGARHLQSVRVICWWPQKCNGEIQERLFQSGEGAVVTSWARLTLSKGICMQWAGRHLCGFSALSATNADGSTRAHPCALGVWVAWVSSSYQHRERQKLGNCFRWKEARDTWELGPRSHCEFRRQVFWELTAEDQLHPWAHRLVRLTFSMKEAVP